VKHLVLALAAAAALACKDQGPKGLDPIVLVKNEQSDLSPVTMTWYDQSGQVQFNTFAPFETRCVEFTSASETDSVRFVVTVGDTTGNNGPWHVATSPWFDPRTGLPTASPEAYPDGAEYWTLTIQSDGGGPVMAPVSSPPC
jgi:hypothetical protein